MATASSLPFTDAELAEWNSVERRWWQALHDLRDHGAEHHALTARLATLEAQLRDPALTQKYPLEAQNATRRRDAWKKRLEFIEADAHSGRLLAASLWHRLPAAEKQRVRERFGMEAAMPAPVMAAWVWQRAKAGQEIPGLAPF